MRLPTATSEAMADLTHLADRSIISVEGPDAETLLKGVITQETTSATPAAFSALLTPQGKIIVDFFLIRSQDGFFIDVATDAAADLERRLKMYRLRAKAEIERRDDLCVFMIPGSPGEDLTLPSADDIVVSFQDPRTDLMGVRAILGGEQPDGANQTGSDGGNDGGSDAYRDLRVANGVPEFGASFGANDVFLLDVNYDALNGVDYAKGCFVGQEVASRMKRKGEVRKRTVKVTFGSDAVPPNSAPEGETPVTQSGAKIGSLIEGPIVGKDGNAQGLAIVRVDKWIPDEPVSVGETNASATLPTYLPS
ncbi:MAG: hypothetical protein AAF668_12480 [Pseudomonadota bacterium]